MTTYATPTRSGLVSLMLLLFIAIGWSFSEEVLSQIGRFAAQDPGVRKGPAGATVQVEARPKARFRVLERALDGGYFLKSFLSDGKNPLFQRP